MPTPLESLIASGTKLWLDSVDPDAVRENRALGATGATSNPVIISDLIKTGRFDDQLAALIDDGLDDEQVAWEMTDRLVRAAQDVFQPAWEASGGDDGYVSFELDPLLEAADCPLSTEERTAQYIELARKWSEGHTNRMIKVPATPGGLGALEEIVAAGVTPNVTLIFSDRQYRAARDAVWRGAQRRDNPATLKSVYSIFISRIDVYTARDVPELSAAAQGQVGIVNAKRIWRENRDWWNDKDLPLRQEIIFASTGVKSAGEPADKYVAALAGSDIQTNPPATNAAIQDMQGKSYEAQVESMPPDEVLAEIDSKVDFERMETVLMTEGLKKFADPQTALLSQIADKRAALAKTE